MLLNSASIAPDTKQVREDVSDLLDRLGGVYKRET